MKTAIEKEIYAKPQLECVKLDNDISLALESSPPEGPGEGWAFLAPSSLSSEPMSDLL